MKRKRKQPRLLRRVIKRKTVRLSDSLKQRREEQERAERQAAIPMPPERPPLKLYHASYEERWYVAVCKHGYGVHLKPAMAIALAQTEVPVRCHPSQLLIYEAVASIEPIGFEHNEPQWPNGSKPRLVGLTTTHQLFKETPK
jgi:hypothetical protein